MILRTWFYISNYRTSLKVLGRCAIVVDLNWSHSLSAEKYETRRFKTLPRLKCNYRHAIYQAVDKWILCTGKGLIDVFCNHNTTHQRSQFAWRAEALAWGAEAQVWPLRQGRRKWKWRRRHWISWWWVFFLVALDAKVSSEHEERRGSTSPVRVLEVGWIA